VIFVDTNVFMYAVGRPHRLQNEARSFFERSVVERTPLQTSAEVLQELMHAYLPVHRVSALDAAFNLVTKTVIDVWPLEPADVQLARQLHDQFPDLGARDLCHLASCRRRGVTELKTFDRGLAIVARRFL
jgi:predicted nucleic acid-binding protein